MTCEFTLLSGANLSPHTSSRRDGYRVGLHLLLETAIVTHSLVCVCVCVCARARARACTAFLIAQVFVSSEQVMNHWIAVIFGVGQTCLQLFLGVARLD